MNKVALALLTCDRPKLTARMMPSIIDQPNYDTWWCDGSRTPEGLKLFEEYKPSVFAARGNVIGGAGAGIIYALTEMLNHPRNYDHIGLIENDVLLAQEWFKPTLALFDRGRDDGLAVGAVSARCYDDRILIQRDGYAVMHNLGAGMVILTRAAAVRWLATYRAGWSTDNRRIFAKACGVDIGGYWAFRDATQWLSADWHADAALAAYGYSALALVPSPCLMIGQNPPLAEQGLRISDKPVDGWARDDVFAVYRDRTAQVRNGVRDFGIDPVFACDTGTWTVFPHQFYMLGAQWAGDWAFRDQRDFGCLIWHSGSDDCTLTLPLFGGANLIVGGAGRVVLDDPATGHHYETELTVENNQLVSVPIPGVFTQREVTLRTFGPGVRLHGLQMREAPVRASARPFDYSLLPRAM